jgi:hypothetical protein
MNRAAWVCDSCESNNVADQTICWLCRRPQGSATGEVPVVLRTTQPWPGPSQPRLVESKHTTPPPEGPKITLTPPPTSRREPKPSRPKRPEVAPVAVRPPVSGRTVRRVIVTLVLGAGVVGALANKDKLVALIPDFSGPNSTTNPQENRAGCPEAVAKWLPGGGSGSELVAQYDADKYVVTVCQDVGGQYYYDGQVRGVAASTKTHINLPATQTSSGFSAQNKSFLYEISGSDLVLTNSGKLVSHWVLTPVHS